MIAGLDLVSLIGWIVIVGAGLGWEIKALVDPKRGDTLSETVWRGLRAKEDCTCREWAGVTFRDSLCPVHNPPPSGSSAPQCTCRGVVNSTVAILRRGSYHDWNCALKAEKAEKAGG